jgi:hypothetical protein
MPHSKLVAYLDYAKIIYELDKEVEFWEKTYRKRTYVFVYLALFTLYRCIKY